VSYGTSITLGTPVADEVAGRLAAALAEVSDREA
jgi:hypothetical protein